MRQKMARNLTPFKTVKSEHVKKKKVRGRSMNFIDGNRCKERGC